MSTPSTPGPLAADTLHDGPSAQQPQPDTPARPDAPEQPAERPADGPTSRHQVLILGGGVGGLAVARQLTAARPAPRVTLVEPEAFHYDQPAWMRVGTEGVRKESTREREAPLVPEAVNWVQARATAIDPNAQVVTTSRGARLGYDVLIVALGITVRWDRVRGLEKSLGRRGVCSVYGYEAAERTWNMIRAFEGGRAFFTAPSSPYKGGGAPLSLLHRAEKLWRRMGVRQSTEIFFATASAEAFGGRAYAEMIEHDARAKDIHVYGGHELIEVRPESKEAVFSVRKGRAQSRSVLPFDLIHVVPPMRPPAVVEASTLAYPSGPMRGYLEVRPDTLQHPRYRNVFGVGDAVGIETVKTGAEARKQAEALARHVRQAVVEA